MDQLWACEHCGTVGTAKTTVRGSVVLELCLYFLAILPGLLYSIWRSSTRRRVCARCGSAALVPADTPRGRQIASSA